MKGGSPWLINSYYSVERWVGRRERVAIIGVAVGDDVLRNGVNIRGRHVTCCGFRELTDDCNLIGRFGDVVWDQELMVIGCGGVCASAESLLEVSQLHFR